MNNKLPKNSKGIIHLGLVPIIIIVGALGAAGAYIISRSDLRGDPVAMINRKIKREIENAPKGCCIPFCAEDVTELECERVHGGRDWIAQSCSSLDECNKGCCLPNCKDVSKVECEGYGEGEDSGFGYGGSTFVDSNCSALDECAMGCCTLDGIEFDELNQPCTSVGGSWRNELCEEEEDDGQYTVHFGDDCISGTQGETQPMTMEICVSNAWAQTCDGLHSRWEGTAHQKFILRTAAGEDVREGDGEFNFVVMDEPYDTKLSEDKKTLTIEQRMNCAYCEDPHMTLVGTISKGATGCN